MKRYITATVIVERIIQRRNYLLIAGDNLASFLDQLAVCDRENAILERELRHLENDNRRLRQQIQEREVEIRQLRTSCLKPLL